MKKFIMLSATCSTALLSGAALAHTGDHGTSNLIASLSHVFSSGSHAAAALVVLGVVGSIAAYALRRQPQAKVERAD